MNRAQRRKQKNNSQKNNWKYGTLHSVPKSDEPDFSSVPIPTLCQSIQLLINELRSRGISIYDFDDKERAVQAIQMLQGKVFFLAAKEDELK